MDIADERNTGNYERALSVEQCLCPAGYRGLSCEDCDVGFTRAPEGLYLGLCEACNCNGHSNECDPETGICQVNSYSVSIQHKYLIYLTQFLELC